MSPVAIPSVSELVANGQKHTIDKSAPSIVANGKPGPLRELDASRLIITRNTQPKAVPEPNSPEVWAQNICTDHMITTTWTSTTGWSTPHLKPYGPLTLMPTASVLHYATECFEGLKFYRGHDQKLRLFRPDCNSRRMLDSATRIALPAFDPKELLKLIVKLVAVDGGKWLPKSRPGTFLYLRPTMIATADSLGVQKPAEALLYVFACCFPCLYSSVPGPGPGPGPCSADADNGEEKKKKEKAAGMTLLASREDTVRAWPGGFGFAKVGANYGPSLIAQAEARERGFDQVLWLLGAESSVTEVGASNFFVVWRTRGEEGGKLQMVTAPLGEKIILDGVTRRSVLQLARERLLPSSDVGGGDDRVERKMANGNQHAHDDHLEGLEVVERTFTMAEIEAAVEEERLVEAFACGTAFFISPISHIHYRGKDLRIPMAMNNGSTGAYAATLRRWLENIMYGAGGEEGHEWGVVVEERELDA